MTNTKKFLVSDDDFADIVKNSFSVREVIRSCGLIPAGGNHQTTTRRIKKLNLDTTHFSGQRWNKGKQLRYLQIPIESYLSNERNISSHKLRLKLFSSGIKKENCENCGLHVWQGVKIPLELHHIDGNHSNNTLSNILILCPNCHALTQNYRGKNKNKS